jgi:helicase
MSTSNKKNCGTTVRALETSSGIIEYPAYIPVTTFGDSFPLDALIQPYLPRLAPAVMVSFHYAQAMKKKLRIPTLIDSGGFAALFDQSVVVEKNGLGILRIHNEEGTDELSPMRVLDFQELNADVAFTLDFPIPPNMGPKEADKRSKLTIANAIWAIENRRRKGLRLFASLQGLKAKDYFDMAKQLKKYPFDGFAIGGMVPRSKDKKLIQSVISGVRKIISDRPLHVFGLGKPETSHMLFELGVDSVDSSSYVKLAADGKSWSNTEYIKDPAVTDRLMLALQNLKTASEKTPFGHRTNRIG